MVVDLCSKLVQEKYFFDLTFTDFRIGCQEFGIISENIKNLTILKLTKNANNKKILCLSLKIKETNLLKKNMYLVDWASLCSKVWIMLTNRDKPFCFWHRFMHYELEIPSLFKKYCPLQTWFTFFNNALPNFHI